jgi:hypothetical protein
MHRARTLVSRSSSLDNWGRWLRLRLRRRRRQSLPAFGRLVQKGCPIAAAHHWFPIRNSKDIGKNVRSWLQLALQFDAKIFHNRAQTVLTMPQKENSNRLVSCGQVARVQFTRRVSASDERTTATTSASRKSTCHRSAR